MQTVRRLGVEEVHGKLAVGSDVRLWAQPHAAFLYNRFHVCPHLQMTPYEAAFGGKPYAGKICIFGETVFAKMSTPYKGGAQWVVGAWMSPSSGMRHVITDKGGIEAASVRRSADQQPPGKFCGLPWQVSSAVLRPKTSKKIGPVAVTFPIAAAPPTRDDDEHGPSSDEEANAVEEAAKNLTEKGAASDTSEEMIKGDRPPPSRTPSARREPGRGSDEPSPAGKRKAEHELSPDAAYGEAQTGTKRTLEEAQGEAQTSTKRTQEEAQGKTQTGTKRTQEEADLGEGTNLMSIRLVETVDAEWYAPGKGPEAAAPENGLYEGDPVETISPKHIVTGNADQPPELAPEALKDYDDMAEVEEIERLIDMKVLVEPIVGEEAELLTTTFATTWKGGKGTWWRRARLVARQYRWANDMEAEDTFSPASIGSLLRHIAVLSQSGEPRFGYVT